MAKQLVLVTTQLHWFRPENNVLLMLIDNQFARNGLVGWLFGFNGPLRQYFSLYRAVSQREGYREEKRIDESKNGQTTPIRTSYKRSRPLPYCNPNCRTPRHWKFNPSTIAPPDQPRTKWMLNKILLGVLYQYTFLIVTNKIYLDTRTNSDSCSFSNIL